MTTTVNQRTRKNSCGGHESDIILFETAAKVIREKKLDRLPAFQTMKAEYNALSAEKEKLYADYQKARDEAKEYNIIKQNVDSILAIPKETEQKRDPERG